MARGHRESQRVPEHRLKLGEYYRAAHKGINAKVRMLGDDKLSLLQEHFFVNSNLQIQLQTFEFFFFF